MTKEEFSKVAVAMRTYYPNQNLLPNTQSVELWYMQLCDIPYQVMTVALNEWVSTNKWAPTIADMREATARLVSEEIPDWNSAYEHSRSIVKKYGYYNAEEAMKQLPEIEKEVVKNIGYIAWCKSENPSVIRAQYRDVYNIIAERKRRENQLPPGLKNVLRKLRDSKVEVLKVNDTD